MVCVVCFVVEYFGLFLDLVYIGKVFVGFFDFVERGVFGVDEMVVFIYIGGVFVFFVYEEEFGGRFVGVGE